MIRNAAKRRTSNRSHHLVVATILVSSLALGLTPTLVAQGPSSTANLLTPIGSWQTPEELKSTVAVEGLNVEVDSKILTRGTPQFSFQAFDGKVYQADLEELTWNDHGAITWVGKISEFGEHSQVLLSTYDGAVAGIIDTPDGRYEIDPTPAGHVLIKVDSSRFGGCATKGPEHRHPVPAADVERVAESVGLKPAALPMAGVDANKTTYDIDISVLFTAEVVDEYGSQTNAIVKATASIALLDVAFSNSNVNANANFVGYDFLTEDELGDTSGGEDGMVFTLYSSGSWLNTPGLQDWYQNRLDLEGISESGDAFGYAMAVGNFNNDDYQDLAIGIPKKDIDSDDNTGAVLILYGTDNGLSSVGADYIHQDTSGVKGGNQDGDQFGFSLAVGNFDGDDYDDLAIGKPFENYSNKDNTGAINVLYGSSGGITVSGDQVIYQSTLGRSDENDDQFGYSLAAGDFDGDLIDDLAVGANKEDHSSKNSAGRVVVIYGSTGGLNINDSETFSQETPGVSNAAEKNDRFGETLAVGNFDGDDFDDLVVGVPYEDWGGDNSGLIHVLFGSGGGLTGIGSETYTQNEVGDEREKNDYFGFALAVGDFDEDNISDLMVSAPWEDSDNKGRVHLLYGGSSGLSASSSYLSGGSNDKFGYSLAAGNFDGDGGVDLAIGRPGYDAAGENGSGAVAIYHNDSGQTAYNFNWTQNYGNSSSTPEEDDGLGSVLAAGDFNGDGDSDLAIGAPDEGVSNDSEYFKEWLGDSGMAAASRDAYSADLVGMMVEHLDGNTCGSAQDVLEDTTGDSDIFYQVSKRSCAVSNITFAHEVGHLLGLAHDPDNAGGSGACDDARGHYVNGKGRSLMSYADNCSNGCDRKTNISNPGVNFSFGNASGISGARDNARCANLSVINVAGYQ